MEEPDTLPLIAYEEVPSDVSMIVAPVARDWMDATPSRFAYRCLPMLIANQSGWLVLNTEKISVTWDGGQSVPSLVVEHFEYGLSQSRMATSHFGNGVVTFSIPYLFRTPPGFNLHVRGPANMPKDGATALEGIVETDWSDATFTMNWKLTRPGLRVVFEEDEPIAMLTPVRRGELERFRPVIRDIGADPETAEGMAAFRESRAGFLKNLIGRESEAVKQGWQRHYMRGRTATAVAAREHQTGLSLARFVDEAKKGE